MRAIQHDCLIDLWLRTLLTETGGRFSKSDHGVRSSNAPIRCNILPMNDRTAVRSFLETMLLKLKRGRCVQCSGSAGSLTFLIAASYVLHPPGGMAADIMAKFTRKECMGNLTLNHMTAFPKQSGTHRAILPVSLRPCLHTAA